MYASADRSAERGVLYTQSGIAVGTQFQGAAVEGSSGKLLFIAAASGITAHNAAYVASLSRLYNRLASRSPIIKIRNFGWRRNWLFLCSALVVSACGALGQTASPAFRLRTHIPPRLATGQRYRIHLDAAGGRLPLDWRLSKGKLPPGLQLNAQAGEIVGSPTTVGEFAFTLEATDKSQPPQLAQQDFLVQVIAPLTIVWKDGPRVQGNTINGRVAVSNYTGDTFDLTVIIMAVNEIGRATALGYQKLDLASGLLDFEIPFGSTLPVGKYMVHADAIAEVTSKNAIYRARQQTQRPLEVTQQ